MNEKINNLKVEETLIFHPFINNNNREEGNNNKISHNS